MKQIFVLVFSVFCINAIAQENKLVPYNYDFSPPRDMEEKIFERQFIYSIDKKGKIKEVKLETGNYTIKNNKFTFNFDIDKNGYLNSSARIEEKYNPDGYHIELLYDKGFFKQIKFIDRDGFCFEEFLVGDSLLTRLFYFPSGIIEGKYIYDFRIRPFPIIQVKYYENGNVKQERNDIDNTLIEYYENGTIKRVW